MFFIGCPIWGFKEWVGNFFPAHTPSSDFLSIYSRKLNAVEGNTVFYALPSAETIARWRQETPPTFRFCPKVPRSISHGVQLENSKNETLLFIDRMRELAIRLGPIFLQLPPSFGPAHLPQLEAFLNYWPTDVRLAVEVRHRAFFSEPHAPLLDELLRKHNAARVIMDSRPIRVGTSEERRILEARERKPDVPVHIALTADFVFLRYIGNPSMAVNGPLLDAWAKHLAQWHKQGITPYVFCHCPFTVHAPEICLALYERVNTLTPLPPLFEQPDSAHHGIEQARLF